MPDQIDTSFKTTLLMIQKDFERMSNLIFKPLVFKPRSLFTRAYVMVKEEDKVKFKRNKFNSPKRNKRSCNNRNTLSIIWKRL